MTKTILPSVKLSLLLFLFISITTLNTACAVSPSEVKVLQDKAALAQQDLRLSLENGEDVSTILPLMQQVKPLADQGEIQQAIQLLDTILIAFERNKVTPPTQINQIFSNPRPVTITGYKQSVMEAFISRDGRYLFFNNEDGEVPKQNKNIYYAERINDTHFKFMGEVKGINSHEVDAVPTMDNDNNFYFVSTAHYGKKNGFNTVYSGKFKNGHVTNIKPHPELSLKLPGWLNMDIEISADGNTLYATHTDFSGGSPPKGSYFFIAHKQYQKFVIDTNSDAIFEHINSDALEYAAAISNDELELFFTRLNFKNGISYTTHHTTRPDKSAPFSIPTRLDAITGISEAITITADGLLAYFHKKVGDHFALFVLDRVQ